MQFPNAEKLPLLAEAGFGLIPLHQWDAIGPRNRKVGKAPVGKDWWSSPPMTVDEAADHMRTGGNVGIPLGKPVGDRYLCCYDIDLGNLPNGVKDVPRLVRRIAAELGVTVDDLVIHQSGNDGLHVFFLSGEADLRGFAEVDGVKVEIKSKGQQVVAPGSIHPDTGRPYQVHPNSAAHRKLPVAPEPLVERLRKPTSSNAGPQTLPPSRIEWIADQIRGAIDIGADVFEGYDDWVRGGMAFHAASGGGDHGLDAWIACSHAGEADHCRDKWRGFGGGDVTDRTLNHYLANAGVDPAEAPAVKPAEFAEFVADDFAGVDDEQPKPLSRKKKLYSLAELIDLPEPEWLVERAVPKNGLVVLYGPPKSAKTFLALDMALSVGTDQEQLHGFQCKSGKVLYVLAEGGAPMMGNRARAWLQCKGKSDADVAVLPSSILLSSKKSVDGLLELAGNEWDLVIVDTLARCMDGDENSVKDMNAAIKGCDYIRTKTGAAVMLVHHSGKDQAKGMRGSTALLGAVDGTIRMRATGGGFELAVTELRHGEPPEPRMLRLQSTHGSAVLVKGQAADADIRAQILEVASHLDGASRKTLADELMVEFQFSGSTARRNIAKHIPSGRENAVVYEGVSIWREPDSGSSSPNAEILRVDASA